MFNVIGSSSSYHDPVWERLCIPAGYVQMNLGPLDALTILSRVSVLTIGVNITNEAAYDPSF